MDVKLKMLSGNSINTVKSSCRISTSLPRDLPEYYSGSSYTVDMMTEVQNIRKVQIV